MVGREAELALMNESLDGIGRGLVLRGPRGIGKTALLRAGAHLAERRGFTVLRCQGTPREHTLRYSGLHQLLRPLLADFAGLIEGERDALDVLFGIADGPRPDSPLVCRAASGLLVRAASRAPVLLVLDDLPALDPDSLRVVEYVLRHRGNTPVVVFAAGSTDPLTTGLLPRRDLPELPPDAAGTLVGAVAPRLSAVDRDVVLGLAQGNPLALAEWSRHLVEHGAPLGTCRYDLADFPARLEQDFGIARHGLPRRTARLLVLLAAYDGDIADAPGGADEFWRAAAELELTEADLRAAEQSGVVTAASDVPRFGHPLTRAVLYGTASPAERSRAHTAFADTLTADPDRVVWHRAAATLGRDDHVAARLHAIGEQARRNGAVARAATAYEWAGRLSTAGDAAAHRLGLAADAALRAGHRRHAAVLIGRARSLAEHPAAVPDLILPEYYARVLNDVPGQSVDELLRSLPELPPTHRGLAVLVAAMDVHNSGDPGGEAARIERATVRLGLAADDPLRVITLAAVAPRTHARELMPLVRRHCGRVAELATTYQMVGLGGAAESLRMVPEAEQCYRAAIVACDTENSLLEKCLSMVRHASLLALTGAFAPALTEAREACTQAERLDLTEAAVASAAIAARVHAWQGDVPAAVASLARSARLTHLARPHPATLTEVASARAALALVQGRPAEAVHALLEVAGHRTWAGHTLGDLAEAASRVGGSSAVADVVERIAADAEVFDSDLLRHLTLRARALAGDASLFDEALATPGEDRFPVEWARTRLAHGEWLRRRRRQLRARSRLAAASAVFAAAGAEPWRVRASLELRAAGGTVPSSDPERGDQLERATLTPQERLVARLAGDGLSNQDIAGRIAVSPRTVGTHLANTYAKLGIRRRSELAALLRDGTTGVR
ncbi:LuxR family transcriptional regulator [Cryptosporangium japonicum]|uniref:LuxR family transcriptional regulator n=2 Tax=Cryptosporangium japonicum TaxID=80872 RepID=A0ABN0TI11_9ACTN